ncbi:hypothetical protein AGMMS49941_13340 [Deferribacterales bacterium]|nr:hypothetical protein AGMMS49941_13340 [Deferribacterales bacterium]
MRSPLRIVEEKDASDHDKKIQEVNTGIYYCNATQLLKRLAEVKNVNAQKEYYLTDIIHRDCYAHLAANENEFLGVNDPVQLAVCARQIWSERAKTFMRAGVRIVEPDSTYISPTAKIGEDVVIYPNVYINGSTQIASGCIIRHGVRLENSKIGKNTEIRENTLIEDSVIGSDCGVGPMAHIRPETKIAGGNNIGNFVELKKATIGKNSKVPHLTYLGDVSVGADTNIGCGTITCNYDGYNKSKTEIGSNVFVGSDVQLIAPVKVGDGAMVGAGTTVTKNVPAGSLSLSRTPQINHSGMADKLRKLKSKKHK